MTPEKRIEEALKVAETGGMMQFGKDSAFAQALRDLLAKVRTLEERRTLKIVDADPVRFEE